MRRMLIYTFVTPTAVTRAMLGDFVLAFPGGRWTGDGPIQDGAIVRGDSTILVYANTAIEGYYLPHEMAGLREALGAEPLSSIDLTLDLSDASEMLAREIAAAMRGAWGGALSRDLVGDLS